MRKFELKQLAIPFGLVLIIGSLCLLTLSCSETKVVKLENGATLEFQMVDLPGGQFQMGSTKGDDDEQPVHAVKVAPFSIGKYEVTQEQWYKVMSVNPSSFKDPKAPVENVSWNDIQEFLRKVGDGYRLPTEAEWEYAARAGSETEFSFGDDPYESLISEFAWYGSNSDNRTHAVGLKKPNKFGLYDMHGNVNEWVDDQYRDNYNGAPINGGAWTGLDMATSRVIRGGSWFILGLSCRSADRGRLEPGSRSFNVGFRLSRTLP